MSPGTGAALRILAATADAKAVAEIGTGTGVSGLHLLHGMRPDGVLTTVDPEPDRQQFAREAFRAAGFAGNRARFIPGRALDVLPRLADGGYDLVFCDGDRTEYLDYLAESLRLLRPGGLVCFEGAFSDGRTVDSGPQPAEVLRIRELLRTVRESQDLICGAAPGGRRPALRRQALTPARCPGTPNPANSTAPARLYDAGAVKSVGASASADDLLQGVAECIGFVRSQFDDKSSAAFERNAHDDAPPLLGHLERAVARPRLHGRHARSPS